MISAEFDFHAPTGVDEALALLDRHADSAKVLAGGMSLVPTMNLGLARPQVVISLNHIPELAYVREADSELHIGAMTRHAAVATSDLVIRRCPILAETAAAIGDPQIRHRGTIGGSVAHADPAGDYLATLALLDARFVLRSVSGERSIAAHEFFLDIMTTALRSNELLTQVTVPTIGQGTGSAYRRLARVEGAFPIVTAAALVGPGWKTARVAIGGVASRPVLVDLAATIGEGHGPESLARIAALVSEACVGASGDLHAAPEYRQAMAGVFARRAIESAAERLA